MLDSHHWQSAEKPKELDVCSVAGPIVGMIVREFKTLWWSGRRVGYAATSLGMRVRL